MQLIIALGANRVEAMFERYAEVGAAQGQMPGREEGRRKSEDEQEQHKASQQLALSASSHCSGEFWSVKFLGFGVHLVNTEEQGSQVQQRMSEKDLYRTHQGDL